MENGSQDRGNGDDWHGGISIGSEKFTNIIFVHDKAVFSNTEREMYNLLLKTETVGQETDLVRPKQKCSIIIIDKKNKI